MKVFRVITEDGQIMIEANACTPCMRWMVSKAAEYHDGYVIWFPAVDAVDVIVMSIAGKYYKLQQVDAIG